MYQRKLDELGRVVIPAELRQEVAMDEKSTVCMTVRDGGIFLAPQARCCHCCGEVSPELRRFGSLHLCANCIETIRKG